MFRLTRTKFRASLGFNSIGRRSYGGLSSLLSSSSISSSSSTPSSWSMGSGHSMRFSSSTEELEPREAMEYDVVIVGAGPSGLAAAIRLKQLAAERDDVIDDINVCVVEKGSEVGAHVLSGNVFQPNYLEELFPDWKERGAPLETAVTQDQLYYLTESSAIPLPTPPSLHNDGNYIISLGLLTKWLGEQAEELGVEIYPGFSASEVLYGESGQVEGIATADMGVDKDGSHKDTYVRGMELRAAQTLFAEGARGSCSEEIMDKFNLRSQSEHQTYGIGIKEVWEIPEEQHKEGFVMHSIGWPLPSDVYGGSFCYHAGNNQVFIGYVVGLDYANPYLSPYSEFQRFKHHPKIAEQLKGGECISYGARVINEGGYQSIPKLTFPGGALVGCSAGFVNVPKIKGSHNAIKTGMLAADAIIDQVCNDLKADENQDKEVAELLADKEISKYQTLFDNSPVAAELKEVRNIRPAFKWGLIPWMIYSGLESFILRGKVPWTVSHHEASDADSTHPASNFSPIEYPKPDGELSFDLLTNLARSEVAHEDQPSHLVIKESKANVPKDVSFQQFAGPEGRFCPAKVYEYVEDENTGEPRLVINAQNCIHCKTCSIKTPQEYIQWTVPEGGGGPNYSQM